jgi:hypothetical protein
MSSNHVFNISFQLMTSSRMWDRVNSTEKSKSRREIISEGRKEFKVEDECGTDS